MTQIGLGVEKDKKDDKDQLIINSPYVIQPHIQQRRKPSNFMVFIAILLTLCVIVMTVLGMVWLVRSHVWLSYWNPVTEPTPTPAYDGGHEYGKFGGAAGIQSVEETRMTFDEIWSVRAKSFSGQWLRDPEVNHIVYRDDYGNLVAYDVDINATVLLVPNTTFVDNNIIGYYPNYNGNFILLTYDHQKVWRYSFRSMAMIYDTVNQVEIDFPSDSDLRNDRLQYVNWAPMSNRLVFVQDNNVYHQAGPETTNAPIQITDDGNELYIFNGIPDWVYEEDVLGSASASYFSDNGEFLIFARFDDTNVPLVEYPLYLPTTQTYASQYKAAYPTAGNKNEDGTIGNNTIAELYLVDTAQTGTPLRVKIDPPTEMADIPHYYTRVAFAAENTVAITWVNRPQTMAIIQICDFTSNGNAEPSISCGNNYVQTVENGWIDAPWPTPMVDLEAGLYYTYLRNGESDGSYKHIASITIPANDTEGDIEFIQMGAQEVQGLLAYDTSDTENMLYFYSTNGTQRNRHLMRMNPEDTNSIECMSCLVEDCDYVSASFSPSAEYFLLSCLGPDVPRYELYNASMYQIAVMEDNQELKDALAAKDLPVREFMQFNMTNGVYVSAEVYHPPDRAQNSYHPLLVYVYGGPGSLQVTSRFGYGSTTNNWLRYLGSAFNVAVASVDARGTIGLGEEWKFQMYKKLANIEIEDQIAFGESLRLRDELDYLNDDDPAAIFGWSYGGFAASHVLGRNETSFGCALAVAPVSSKRYYDTAYTERYMGLITDDEAAYDATDLFPYAPNFKDRKYFIAHGTHDDNVHFRHFTTFVDALTRAEVQFRSQVYVDEDHSINSPQQSQHLFQAMTNFLNDDCYTYGYQAPTSSPTVSTTPGGSESHRITFTLLLAALLAAIFGALH